MPDLKSNLTCPLCSLIYKDPIVLSCGHSICAQHLQLKEYGHDGAISNTIKCMPCNSKAFKLSEISMVPNVVACTLINEGHFLSVAVKTCKINMETLFNTLEKLNNEYELLKDSFQKIDFESREHFEEIRRQIYFHRKNELFIFNKSKIDYLSLNLMQQINTFESTYLKNLKLKISKIIQLDPIITPTKFNEDKDRLNEIFRRPKLEFNSIQLMQIEYEKFMSQIQSKIHELTQIRASLKSNEFLPMYNDQTFGILTLDENSLSNSRILSRQRMFDLVELCKFSTCDNKWKLLYRASRDGFSAKEFHSKCDGHAKTLTICKTVENSFIFGGYAETAWESVISLHKSDANAFIFSLTNSENTPCRIQVEPIKVQYAIYCNPNRGPSFGLSDISVSENARYIKSSSVLGNAYKPLVNYNDQNGNEAHCFRTMLAGSVNFLLGEIEVFEKESF